MVDRLIGSGMADYPPPPFFSITFSNREGCKHEKKKRKGSWG